MPDLTLTTICLMSGHALAWRFSYFVLIPGTIVAISLSVLTGAAQDAALGWILLYAFANVVVFQAGNLFGILLPAFSERAFRGACAFLPVQESRWRRRPNSSRP